MRLPGSALFQALSYLDFGKFSRVATFVQSLRDGDDATPSSFVTFVPFCKKNFRGTHLRVLRDLLLKNPCLTDRDRMNPGTSGAGES